MLGKREGREEGEEGEGGEGRKVRTPPPSIKFLRTPLLITVTLSLLKLLRSVSIWCMIDFRIYCHDVLVSYITT